MINRIVFILNIAFILFLFKNLCTADTDINNKNSQGFRLIKDLDDKLIKIPIHPKKIAMLHGPSYDRILMLGNPDVIALMPLSPTPWSSKVFPKIRRIPVITSHVDVDVEQMLRYKVDLVFFSLYPAQAKKLSAAGIKAVCPFTEKKLPKNMNEFIENYKRQIIFFGEILGPDAMIRARKYCRYFDKTVNRVLAKTSSIPKKKKPRVYYGGLNGDLFYTQGKNSLMQWCIKAAGGGFLTRYYRTHFAKVKIEQLIAWDPDFIFIGMKGLTGFAKNNPALRNIKAIKTTNIYKIPTGIFWWDLASGESVLLPLFLAKKFHPDLFKDWDIIEEMKFFYLEFYDYKLSERDAHRILLALPPG